ncbi:MAG: hypothetical protein AVDCRST_MAG30-1599, partial [uncultured Solirubrobacteraceae bacterium]
VASSLAPPPRVPGHAGGRDRHARGLLPRDGRGRVRPARGDPRPGAADDARELRARRVGLPGPRSGARRAAPRPRRADL